MSLVTIIRQRPRAFYGWWIVALAGFVSSISNTAVKQEYAVFFLPVSEGLGYSAVEVAIKYASELGKKFRSAKLSQGAPFSCHSGASTLAWVTN